MDFFCFPSCATLLNILKPQAGCCCVPPITLAQTFPGSTEEISFDFEKAFSLSEQFRIGFSWIYFWVLMVPSVISPILNSLSSFLTRKKPYLQMRTLSRVELSTQAPGQRNKPSFCSKALLVVLVDDSGHLLVCLLMMMVVYWSVC